MLISIIERFQAGGEREVDRYAAWSDALQALRDDFGAGESPEAGQLHSYLNDVPEYQRIAALQDLVSEHLFLTWSDGSGRELETYLAELGDALREEGGTSSVAAELVEDEFLARCQSPHGDRPTVDDYRRRFPHRPDVISLLDQRSLGGGRFVKLRQLGHGAMGEVWEALDRQADRAVAIKEPRANADPAERVEALRGFAGEAQVTIGLEHAGIANLRENRVGEEDPVYTMRLVRGERLSDRIGNFHQPSSRHSRRERFARRGELLQWLVSACDAVRHAHGNGILHRDLKPGNLAVVGGTRAVVLDWGMAMRMLPSDPQPVTPVVAGTPEYMPPEQADGIADVRSDVFGLGAILYEILTGCPPHAWSGGVRPMDWPDHVRQARIRNPRRLNRQIPRRLAAICMKCLARDPDCRYQSVVDLAEDVNRCLGQGQRSSATFWPTFSRARTPLNEIQSP